MPDHNHNHLKWPSKFVVSMDAKNAIWMAKNLVKTTKTSLLGHFWDFFGPHHWRDLFFKNQTLSLFLLHASNFMQKIRKNWRANPEILHCEWMDEQIDQQSQIKRTLLLIGVSKEQLLFLFQDLFFRAVLLALIWDFLG